MACHLINSLGQLSKTASARGVVLDRNQTKAYIRKRIQPFKKMEKNV